MTKDEVRKVLSEILDPEISRLDSPTGADWQRLEERFGTRFPSDFKSFIELMAEFSFPGDIYNVSASEKTNGNDLIEVVYDSEISLGWPSDLVPFYGIGNGDYFALDRREGTESGVYYRYHENGIIKPYARSFEEWIKRLPAFLRGED